MDSYKDDLCYALELAGHADALTMHRFEAADLSVNEKPDMSPVTDADIACEKLMRDDIARYAPDDDILGEEFGGAPNPGGRQWVIDPIDGTKNFVRGVPVWATLIALVEDGEPVVSVISAPALRRRWYASKDEGAYRVFGGAPKQLEVSQVAKLDDASLAISSLHAWAERGKRDSVVELTDRTWRQRGYGDFWNYCLVAEGAVDIAAEPEVPPWDMAAPELIVQEAGGTFTDLSGKRIVHDENGWGDSGAIATNGTLHHDALNYLRLD